MVMIDSTTFIYFNKTDNLTLASTPKKSFSKPFRNSFVRVNFVQILFYNKIGNLVKRNKTGIQEGS